MIFIKYLPSSIFCSASTLYKSAMSNRLFEVLEKHLMHSANWHAAKCTAISVLHSHEILLNLRRIITERKPAMQLKSDINGPFFIFTNCCSNLKLAVDLLSVPSLHYISHSICVMLKIDYEVISFICWRLQIMNAAFPSVFASNFLSLAKFALYLSRVMATTVDRDKNLIPCEPLRGSVYL